MLLVGVGLKLKHVKGDEVNGKPKQEEEKEMGKGGGAWPEIDQIVRLCMKVKVRMMYKPGGVAEIGRAGTDLRKEMMLPPKQSILEKQRKAKNVFYLRRPVL